MDFIVYHDPKNKYIDSSGQFLKDVKILAKVNIDTGLILPKTYDSIKEKYAKMANVPIEEIDVQPIINKCIFDNINKLIDYTYMDEKKHYEELDESGEDVSDHIFNKISELADYFGWY